MLRELVDDHRAAELVARAHGQLVERGEHVELRQRDRRDPVQPHGVAERDEVEPAAAALAAGDRAELAAELAHPLLVRPLDLGRERTRADARDVGLRDADHGVDPRRPDPDPRAAPPASVGRGGDERIRAVVDVEQRPVRALEEDVACRRGSRGRRAATCPRGAGAAAARTPRTARRAPRARSARRRRCARATRSSRRARPRSSGGGSSGRRGPAAGCRAGMPCRRTSARSRAASSRSGASRAAARSPGRAATCHGMIMCAFPESRRRARWRARGDRTRRSRR